MFYVLSSLPMSKAQDGKFSSVMWANCSNAKPLTFKLQGIELKKSWAPGSSGGARKTETTAWNVDFKPEDPLVGFSKNFSVESGSSSLGLLIGDFKNLDEKELENIDAAYAEKTPPGFTKLEGKGYTRASLLKFSVPKSESLFYPLYLVNGVPDSTISVKFIDGTKYILKYGESQFYNSPVDVRVKVEIELGNYKEVVAYMLDKNERGGVMGFYKSNPESDNLDKIFVNLNSLESLEKRHKKMVSDEM